MILKEKKEYIYILAIATTLIVGRLQISSSSYVFFDKYTLEQITVLLMDCLRRKTLI